MTPDISDLLFFFQSSWNVFSHVYSQDKNNVSVQYIKNLIPEKLLNLNKMIDGMNLCLLLLGNVNTSDAKFVLIGELS